MGHSAAPVVLTHPEGTAVVEDLGFGRRRVVVQLVDPSAYLSEAAVETDYPLPLIEAILALRGPAMVGYSIKRAEDPAQLVEPLRHYTLAYVNDAELDGARLLDFGCGSGSSTIALARLFPRTEIVAVDLDEGNVSVARLRAQHYEVANAVFRVSPGPFELPPDLGTFDVVYLSAVYEHLLPAERPVLMAKVWDVLRPGGTLFLNQTPHRFYPLEGHTTGLPLLNYVPRRLAHPAARHLSNRVGRDATWESLLRAGVRGGTEGQILRHLRATGDGRPLLLQPSRLGCHDQVDLWYSLSIAQRPHRLKRIMRAFFKLARRVTGRNFVPNVNVAIRKA